MLLLPEAERLTEELLLVLRLVSGRYILTVLPLTLVERVERFPLLSSLRTEAFLPLARRYSEAVGPL